METKTITTEDLKQILSALDEAYYFISQVADERDEHPICEMIGKAMEAIDYVSILTINTMETKNYAELSSLKWGVEDININVERAYDAGYITEDRMNELLSMTDANKIAFLEGVIESIESHLMEQINVAIFESITEQTEY